MQDALKKLIAAFPEKEANDRETKEQKIQALAAELDQLSYEIDNIMDIEIRYLTQNHRYK